ncbi:hypothetical protein [Amedibacillus dolichus]|uniref:hypothetical protein n=1 Tax=Amedibacillus dolichus TaxID=31971 RepID=UPI0021752420|nr:hypothetical protein [Amedibacillus dolichus]
MVKNKFLLLIAAVVWLIAGYNVLRIGWIAYINYINLLIFLFRLLFSVCSGFWFFINWYLSIRKGFKAF